MKISNPNRIKLSIYKWVYYVSRYTKVYLFKIKKSIKKKQIFKKKMIRIITYKLKIEIINKRKCQYSGKYPVLHFSI